MGYGEILKEQWERLKTVLLPWFNRAGRYFLLLNVLLYGVGCAVAGAILSPAGYIAFLDHCCKWRVS